MLLAGFILVTIKREHDRLQQGINLCQRDQSAEGGNVAGFGLKEEEEVSIRLELAIIWEQAVGLVCFLEMFRDLALLLDDRICGMVWCCLFVCFCSCN